MLKGIIVSLSLLMANCKVDRVPDYGSRDKYLTGFDGCLSGVSSYDGSLWLILILVAAVFYLLGKSRGGGK